MSKVKNEDKVMRFPYRKLEFVWNFYHDNKLISILTLAGIIIILSYYISFDFPELIVGIDKWYKLSCDLSIGILASFIFFLFQIYLPGIQEEKKALLMIKSQLSILCREMQELILVSKHYFITLESGYLQILEQKSYYKLVSIKSVDGLGWAREFDFYNSITEIKRDIESIMEKITSNISFNKNHKELIEIISKLQANNFLKDIERVQNYRYDPVIKSEDISNSFLDFCFIFDRIKKFDPEFDEKQLVVLNETEKARVINGINSLPQLRQNIGIFHIYL